MTWLVKFGSGEGGESDGGESDGQGGELDDGWL